MLGCGSFGRGRERHGEDGADHRNFRSRRGVSGQGAAATEAIAWSAAQRRNAGINSGRLEELGILADVELADMELLEESNIRAVLRKLQPDEIYHLAAQSFVGLSFEQPLYTCDVNALGVLRLLECIREAVPRERAFIRRRRRRCSARRGGAAKRDHALSSAQPVWREQAVRALDHGELPRSLRPVRLLRHSLQSRIATAWREFVTRKVTLGLAQVALGKQDALHLGNLEASRDWGYAAEYVEGMWMMLQQEQPDDYVLATGRTHSVRDFVNAAGEALGFALEWSGEGADARGIDKRTGKTIVIVTPEFYRPAEVDLLIGDPRKAKQRLNWEAQTSLEELVQMMAKADFDRVQSGVLRL